MNHDLPAADDAPQPSSPFRDLSPRQRIGLGAGLVIVLVGLAWTTTSRSNGEMIPLMTEGMASPSLSGLEATFRDAGLNDFRRSGGEILVPRTERDRYVALLPSTSSNADNWAAEWERQNERLTPFSSSRAREATREIARAKLIAGLLRQLPDIEQADVVWDEDEQRGWREVPKTRATVYLMPKPDRVLTLDVVRSVRLAVAGSKKNLDPSDVAVMDLARQVTYDGELPQASGEELLPALRSIAELHRREIRQRIPELRDADVTVSVDLPGFFKFLNAHPGDADIRLTASAPDLLRVSAIVPDHAVAVTRNEEEAVKLLADRIAAVTGIGDDAVAGRIDVALTRSPAQAPLSATSGEVRAVKLPLEWQPYAIAIAVMIGLSVLMAIAARRNRRRLAQPSLPQLNNVNGTARPLSGVAGIAEFDALMELDAPGLRAVYPHATPRRWAVALRGSSTDLLEQMTAALDAGDAADLREQSNGLGPVTIGDIESSRQRILESAQSAYAPAA